MHRISNGFAWIFAVVVLVIAAALWTEGRAHAGRTTAVSADYFFPSVGLVDGDGARISVANLQDVPPGPCRITLLDSQGSVVADSGDLTIPGQGIASFNVVYSRLAIAPERGTSRKQFRVRVNLSNSAGLPADPVRPGLELVNTSTGHTFAFVPPPDANFTSMGM